MSERSVRIGLPSAFVALIAIIFAIASFTLASSASAQTVNTITLTSGPGAAGMPDPNNEFSFNNGITWQPATIVVPGQAGFPTVGYDTIAGTNWIARNATGANPANVTTRYRSFFTLPSNYQFAYLTVQVHADNKVTVYLNGTPIGGQAQNVAASNFQNPPEVFASANQSLFQAGQNALEFYVYNSTNVSGVDYSATVTYFTPPPGTSVPSICANPTISGTNGNDAIVSLGGPNIIDAKDGNDAIVTGPFNDIICGGNGNDRIASGAGNDIIIMGNGDDIADGGDGQDVLLGGAGNDVLHGGNGFDACSDNQGTNTFSLCP